MRLLTRTCRNFRPAPTEIFSPARPRRAFRPSTAAASVQPLSPHVTRRKNVSSFAGAAPSEIAAAPLTFAANWRHDGAEIFTSNPPRETAASSNEHEILMLRRYRHALRFPQYKCRVGHRCRGYARRCLVDEDDRLVHSWPQQHRVGRGQSNQRDAEQDSAARYP